VRAKLGHPALWVFALLLGSYAYFWHSRDWNTASRLMLTYAIVDRHTVSINGLEGQTGDKAAIGHQYYSDKLPGFSLLAAAPYAAAKWILRLPSHPLGTRPKDYWPADYYATLGTSGVLTGGTAVLLVLWALELGCSRGRAALIGLAYGLATPAYIYATLGYGHQAAAFALFACFFLLRKPRRARDSLRVFAAGFLAAYAAVIELQVGPVSAILGLVLLAQVLRQERAPMALGVFAVGAAIPTLLMTAYNYVAFGSPWDLGYFHHAYAEFAEVHNRDNPLGLVFPADFAHKLSALLFGRYRGLTFYAPILWLSIPGWIVMLKDRQRTLVTTTVSVVVAVVLVNVCYPEWTGGWSTGPRLLLPLVPFAMLPVAAMLSGDSLPARAATVFAVLFAFCGGTLMFLFQGADGRVPHDIADPLMQGVWPLWAGQVPVPGWRFGERFCGNIVSTLAPRWTAGLPPSRQALQFVPLLLAQALAITALWGSCRRDRARRPATPASTAFTASTAASSDLRVGQ
jgi:hypothetical protein